MQFRKMAGEGEDEGGEVDHDDHRREALVHRRDQVLSKDDGQGLEGRIFLHKSFSKKYTAHATAKYVLPVPADPIPNVKSLLRIARRYSC